MFIDTDRQLRKLSIFKPMNYRIVEIDFDFDDAVTDDDQQEIVDEVMATTWTAADGDDLVEEITSATGYVSIRLIIVMCFLMDIDKADAPLI